MRVIVQGRRRLASASRCTSIPTRWRRRRSSKILRPARQVHRRPAGELRHRHPRPRPSRQGAHGRRCRTGRIIAFDDRRPDRHRPLLDVSAHQRRRGATRSSTSSAGPTTCRNYRATRHAWCSRTRRRPASTAPSATRSPCAVTEGLVDLAAAGARHGPGRDPPPQPDPRRRATRPHFACRHQVRGAVAPRLARQARRA